MGVSIESSSPWWHCYSRPRTVHAARKLAVLLQSSTLATAICRVKSSQYSNFLKTSSGPLGSLGGLPNLRLRAWYWCSSLCWVLVLVPILGIAAWFVRLSLVKCGVYNCVHRVFVKRVYSLNPNLETSPYQRYLANRENSEAGNEVHS